MVQLQHLPAGDNWSMQTWQTLNTWGKVFHVYVCVSQSGRNYMVGMTLMKTKSGFEGLHGPFQSKWTVIDQNKQSWPRFGQKSGCDVSAKGGFFVNIKPSTFQSRVDLWMAFCFGTFCLCLSPSKTLTVQLNGSLHRRKSGRLPALHAPRWPDQWALTSSIYLRKHSLLANMHQPVTTPITLLDLRGLWYLFNMQKDDRSLFNEVLLWPSVLLKYSFDYREPLYIMRNICLMFVPLN